MKYKLLLLALLTSTVLGTHSYAHASFAATYFEDKTQTIEGKTVRFIYRDTYSFVHVEAPNESGQMQVWAVECGPRDLLSQDGAAELLKPGDHVIVTGNPGRNSDDHRLRMQTITRPSDGWKWPGVTQ
jgi:hypothetical protein